MTRVLITGMSATGKSSIVAELRARGYRAIDCDEPEWSEYRPNADLPGGQEWMWREDAIRALLDEHDAAAAGEAGERERALFVAGCASNMPQFYPRFDEIVLLTAPVSVTLARLAGRTNNDYGKSDEEREQVLHNTREVEPLLRRRATLEIDTSAPLEEVVAAILDLVG